MSDIDYFESLYWPVAVMVFIWGLVWGSFFNVCIYRIPVGKSVVTPGSHCYSCGSPVRWYDNIPLLSYLLLRGNCRFCGTHFSPRYFFVELLTGLLFLAVFVSFGFQWETPFHMVFVSFLIIGTFTDIDHFIIPDRITLGGMVFAIVATGLLGPHSLIAREFVLSWEMAKQLTFQWSAPDPPEAIPYYVPFLFSVFSAAFGYGMLWAVGLMGKVLFRKEAMGMGDVKLFAFLGAWLGPLNCIWILFLSAFVGAIMGLSLLLAHRLVGEDEYDTLELKGDPTVESQWLTAVPQFAPPSGDAAAATPAPAADGSEADSTGLLLKFPRRTSHQLHHFPYGPYIALAAIIVLLLHEVITRGVRAFFLLG